MPQQSSKIMEALEWAYKRAIDSANLPGLETAHSLAHDYSLKPGTLHEQTNSLIRWQTTKAGTAGFITGLGGFLAMPVTIPANLASVFYIQLRMIAAIAIMAELDPEDDTVKVLAFACLAGNATVTEVLKQIGIKIGTKLTRTLIRRVSFEIIKNVNRAVGFRMITKFGQTGAVNMGKAIPVIGGLIGGAFDAASTKAVGHAAQKAFLGK